MHDEDIPIDNYYKAYFATTYKIFHWLKEDQSARERFTEHSLALQESMDINTGVPEDSELAEAIGSCLSITHQLFHVFTGTHCDNTL